MTSGGGSNRMTAGMAALAALLAAAPAAAQSVNEYRLPGTVTTQPSSAAPGPVDSDAPVVRTPAPRPSAQPPATPSSAASPQPTATAPAPQPRREAVRRVTTAEPRQQPAPTATTAPTPATTPSAAAPAALPTTLPQAAATPASIPAPAPAPAQAASEDSTWLWPWGALLLALLAGGAGGWFLHRRSARPLALTFEPPVVPARNAEPQPRPAPAPAPAPALAAAPTAANDAEPAPAVAPAALATEGLAITLEARRMSASLMATTLSYTLRLTNTGEHPLSALAVEGDMIAAHASLPPDQQIASDGQRLELRHALVELAPGQSTEFTGDFRLPLSAVTPIRAGDAAYFVPLARFRIEAGLPDGGSKVLVQTFVVGETPENPGAALRPFRLDLGPRVYSRISQRAVA